MKTDKTKTRNSLCYQWIAGFLAEKEGFEPSLRSSRTTPLAGEPLRPLGYFSMPKDDLYMHRVSENIPKLSCRKNGGERGIRTPGAFAQRFSRPSPSTTRTSLRFGRFGIITYYWKSVNRFEAQDFNILLQRLLHEIKPVCLELLTFFGYNNTICR